MFGFLQSSSRPPGRLRKAYRQSSSVLSFNHDGLEIARTRNERRWLPIWHIAVFVYLALLIRLIAIAEAGPAAYANRMQQMGEGTFIERSIATVMQMDPISQKLAMKMRRSLKNLDIL